MDKEREMAVWQRVYAPAQMPTRFPPRQRQILRQSLNRSQENLRVYESMRRDPYYGEAFAHLADETQEHIKMLRQMLP